jgi:hypothetical protein
LLEDIDAEEECDRGRALVNSEEGWQTQMAKWVGDARIAEAAEQDSDSKDDKAPMI